MKNKLTVFIALFFMCAPFLSAQKGKGFDIKSQDGNLTLHVEAGQKLVWSVKLKGRQMIAPSSIALQLGNGEVLGDNANISSSTTDKVNTELPALNYKKATVSDAYNQLTLKCRNDFGVKFRVYNDGVAYRFFTKKKGELIVINEEANFNFTEDYKAFIPYMWDYRDGKIGRAHV